MTTSELETDDGRTLVVKRADPAVASDAARLTREATLLAMARHPGVVELADAHRPIHPSGQADPPAPVLELRTLFAGARTLAAPDLDPLAAARALAAAAGTVADLHALGLVHGRITPDHVLLTGTGRAVLCGFAEAGLAGDLRGDGEVLVPSLDVASLGSVLGGALAAPVGPDERRRSSIDRAAAARLVDRATDADPRLRPSARTFATVLAAALPRAPEPRALTPPPDPVIAPPSDPPASDPPASGRPDLRRPDLRPPDPDRASPEPAPIDVPRRRRGRRLVAATAGLIAIVWLGIGIDALADAPSRATTGREETAVERQPAGEGPQPGGELDLDGHRVTLGTPADQVVRAVWSCAGPEAVVLVRPDGSVFRFDGPAVPGHDVTGVLVGTVPQQAVVERVIGADGCTRLQARTTDRTVTLDVPSVPPSPTSPSPAPTSPTTPSPTSA